MRLIILSGWFMAGVLAWAGPGQGDEPTGGGDGRGDSGGLDFALKPKGLGQAGKFCQDAHPEDESISVQ